MDNKEKGILLLQSALKKYEKGDTQAADKDRELANQYLNAVDSEMDSTDEEKVLYGEGYNFGVIYNVFETNVKGLIKENKNNKAISQIIKEIKGNKVLKEQFNVYNTLSNIKVKNNTEDYVNEAITLIPSITKKEAVRENKKLVGLFKKHKLDEYIAIPDERMSLYEAIEYLIFNKKTIDNIEKYNDCKNVIKEHIEASSAKINENVTEDDFNKHLNETLDKVDTNSLTEDELKLLSDLSKNDNEKVFNEYKKDTLKFITEQMSVSESLNDKFEWNTIYNKVNLKDYNSNSLLEDILSFIKIQNILQE